MSHQVVTLLSDLGTQDTSVAAVKAALMRHVPNATIVDVSHHITEYDLQQAAYLLQSAYKHFPKGTVHIVMTDVFLGSHVRMLLAQKDGYYFIAPDNEVLPLAFGDQLQDVRLCFEFAVPYSFDNWVNSAGVVVAAVGRGDLSAFGPAEMRSARRPLQPQLTPAGIDCNILYVDRYENVVLDITKKQFEEYVNNRPFKIKVWRQDDITKVSNNYNDVPRGAALCRFNDAGYLELALNHAPAASLLGLGSSGANNLMYQGIRIFF